MAFAAKKHYNGLINQSINQSNDPPVTVDNRFIFARK